MDYINANLPMIMSGSVDASKVIEENNCGIVIRNDNKNEIANAIENICNSENLAFFKKNINKISNNYSSENQVNLICDFLYNIK